MKQIKLLFFSFNSILAVIIPRHGNGSVRRNQIERTNIPHPYLIYINILVRMGFMLTLTLFNPNR